MAEGWRDHILKHFTPKVSRLTLVADPDQLLLEEGVLAGIHERGFELIPFDDYAVFRFAYESKYREKWDQGGATDLVVVLRAAAHDLLNLPYDLLRAGRALSFSIGELFPNLSYPVVQQLDRAHLDLLFQAQVQQNPERLGDNSTKDFILAHVFEIVPKLIREPVDLLRVLLRRHYRGVRVPSILDERLISLLRQGGHFQDWPMTEIVPDPDAFFAFLQERWPLFLEVGPAEKGSGSVRLSKPPYGLRFGGPTELPFDHPDIRVYVDNLFLEGNLRPVEHHKVEMWAKTWAAVGLALEPEADRGRRLRGLLDGIEKSIPAESARYSEWLAFALRWAELTALRHGTGPDLDGVLLERLEGVHEQVERDFGVWMIGRYGGLHNQPAIPPVMVHHIPRCLARRLSGEPTSRVALIMMDGLSVD